MSNTASKMHFIVARCSVSSKLLISSLFLGLLGGAIHQLPVMGTNVSTQPATTSSVSDSLIIVPTNLAQTNPVVQQLQGQWQPKEQSSDEIPTLIFTQDGKFLILMKSASGEPIALQFNYQINSNSQPMHLDIRINPTETVLTIFEFTDKGDLRLQLAGTNPGQPRPSGFNSDVTIFQKVSEATSLPPNTEVR